MNWKDLLLVYIPQIVTAASVLLWAIAKATTTQADDTAASWFDKWIVGALKLLSLAPKKLPPP